MKLLSLKINQQYKSLDAFEYKFNEAGMEYDHIAPICFVGLNGSGKSNIIEALSETIAPELCKYGLSAEIAKVSQEAAIRAPDDALTVFVATEMVGEISTMLSRSNPAVSVSEDSALGPAEARVCWSGGFNRIDLNAAATAAIAAIDGFFCEIESPENRKVQNAN